MLYNSHLAVADHTLTVLSPNSRDRRSTSLNGVDHYVALAFPPHIGSGEVTINEAEFLKEFFCPLGGDITLGKLLINKFEPKVIYSISKYNYDI